MINKKVSISLLLAVALGMSACGGGDTTTPDEIVDVDGNITTDTVKPVFADTIITEHTMEEEGDLEITTIDVTDDSEVTLSLGGDDASYFELVEPITRAANSKLLKFKSVPNFETQSNYSVTVIATDSEDNVATKEFTITLTDDPFVFDVAGNMGSILEGSIGTLALTTKEAKDEVTYEVTGSSLFTLSSNVVIFNAPDFNTTDGAVNSYTSTISADDGDNIITLTATASVMDGDNPVPVVKTYLLTDKKIIDGIAETNYEYTYDDNRSLVRVDKTGTFVLGTEFTTFRYFDDHKIMKGYNENGEIESIRVFEDKVTEKNKFAATIINSRLSVDEYVNYLREISDTASFNNNRHLVKYIYGLDVGQTKAELYAYNSDDTLNRELTGDYGSTDIVALSDLDLHTLNVFPSAESGLSIDQLNSLNSGNMPFNLSQETAYIYGGVQEISGKYYAYPKDEDGTYDTAKFVDISYDIDIERYTNGVINEIGSGDNLTTYNNESLLEQHNSYNYNYFINGREVTVTITNDGHEVATYNFEEE